MRQKLNHEEDFYLETPSSKEVSPDHAAKDEELFSLEEAQAYLEGHFKKKLFPTKLKN